jgi:arginine exporter protein ArgO
MVETLQIAGKATLFSIAISLITGGSASIKDNFYAGLTVLVVGVALIILWSILVEREAMAEAKKAARQEFEKLKLEKAKREHG